MITMLVHYIFTSHHSLIDYLKYKKLYITVITIANNIALQILQINLKSSHLNMTI